MRSSVPLYIQIADELTGRIQKGEFTPGEKMPGEKSLAENFGVSLVTVRGAMRILVDKGLIDRRQGKGTFVIGPRDRAVWGLGWLDDLITSVLPARLEILSTGFSRAPSWVAAKFGLKQCEQTYNVQTLRRDTQNVREPFMTTEIFLSENIGKVLENIDISTATAGSKLVIRVVEEKCGIRISNVHQMITAELATPDISRVLAVTEGAPLLVVTRDYFDNFGNLVQVGRSRYRTDTYEYFLNLSATSTEIEKRRDAIRSKLAE